MKIFILASLLFIGFAGSAQSLLSPLPKPAQKMNSFTRALVGPFDSIPTGQSYTGLRFVGPTILYSTDLKTFQQKDLFTLVGISFQKATFDAPSGKYYTDWAFALLGGAGGQFAPSSVSAVTALAISASTQKIGKTKLPFLLTLAIIRNLTSGQTLPGVGPGIPLNN
jgi:hypothetical protein